MIDERLRMPSEMSRIFRGSVWYSGLSAGAQPCRRVIGFRPSIWLPPMSRLNIVVPASWHGSSPFVEAKPSDGELRPDWWKLFNDPILNKLEEQAMAANPDLQAAAERFVQARDVMMKARSQYLPQAGLGFGASDNQAIRQCSVSSAGYFAIRHDVSRRRDCVLGARFLVGASQCHAR